MIAGYLPRGQFGGVIHFKNLNGPRLGHETLLRELGASDTIR